MKLLLLLILFLVTSCGAIIINPHKCHGKIEIGKSDEVYDREVLKEFQVYFEDREIFLNEVLDCKKVSKIKVNIQQSYLFDYKVKFYFKEE